MIRAVVAAVLVALITGELTNGSRWIAARIARWAATWIYHANAERAAARAEEWEALISTTLPTNLSALGFGLGLGAAAVACVIAQFPLRMVRAPLSGTRAELRAVEAVEQERRDQLVERQRAACLDLLSEVSRLRVRAGGATSVPAKKINLYLADVRALAANVQITAANVALLVPSAQNAADRLAEASVCLADTIGADPANSRRHIRRPQFSELDIAAKTFLESAVTLLTEAAS